MLTIEERAELYKKQKLKRFYDIIPTHKEDYIKIANEQKNIDIEKVYNDDLAKDIIDIAISITVPQRQRIELIKLAIRRKLY